MTVPWDQAEGITWRISIWLHKVKKEKLCLESDQVDHFLNQVAMNHVSITESQEWQVLKVCLCVCWCFRVTKDPHGGVNAGQEETLNCVQAVKIFRVEVLTVEGSSCSMGKTTVAAGAQGVQKSLPNPHTPELSGTCTLFSFTKI